jgi:hypothetical protein
MTMDNKEGEAEKAAEEIGGSVTKLMLMAYSVVKSATKGLKRGLHGGEKG